MLKPPYSNYTRLYFYIIDLPILPDIDDQDYIGGWQEDGTVMLFFHREKKAFIMALCDERKCSVIYQADLDYNDWENGGEISPFKVGDISVAPVWHSADANIRLDPSVIFGNGFHPTTRLCLESIVSLISQPETKIQTALDLGCGTGLLAIAAAKSGLSMVKAFDNNELACDVARSNVVLNGLADSVEIHLADLSKQCPDTRVDLVVANLHHTLLVDLFKNPAFWQAKYYVFSGFFTSKEDLLLSVVPAERIHFITRNKRHKWGVWVMERIKEPLA